MLCDAHHAARGRDGAGARQPARPGGDRRGGQTGRARSGLAPPTFDGLLAIRGVVDIVEAGDDEQTLAAACADALAGLDEAIEALLAARRAEGAALAAILNDRLAVIDALTRAADQSPARRPRPSRCDLPSRSPRCSTPAAASKNRLYQEAVLLAAKADIREELDRLTTHVAAARELIRVGGPVGRRLDFLAQESRGRPTPFA